MAHELSDFKFGESTFISKPESLVDSSNDMETTAWILDQLCSLKQNDVAALLDKTQVKHIKSCWNILKTFALINVMVDRISSACLLQKYLCRRKAVSCSWNLNRGERAMSIALYLLAEKRILMLVHNANQEDQKGPGEECIGRPMMAALRSMHANCYYSGLGLQCSIRKEYVISGHETRLKRN